MQDTPWREAPPSWLAPATLEAMQSARRAALAAGRGPALAEQAVREVVLARHPALPASLIGQATAMLFPPGVVRRRLRYRPRLPGSAPGRPYSHPWP